VVSVDIMARLSVAGNNSRCEGAMYPCGSAE
jgi:hypothetical protein